jgi:hypothetical protein
MNKEKPINIIELLKARKILTDKIANINYFFVHKGEHLKNLKEQIDKIDKLIQPFFISKIKKKEKNELSKNF